MVLIALLAALVALLALWGRLDTPPDAPSPAKTALPDRMPGAPPPQ